MKKGFIVISSLILLLSLYGIAFAEEETSSALLEESFETMTEPVFSADENSSAAIEEIYAADGEATRALNLKGTGAYFDAAKSLDLSDAVIEFDLLPQNITQDGFTAFSLVSEDGLQIASVLSITDEGLSFFGEEILDNLHIDWYRIKIISNSQGLRVFINNWQKGDCIPLPEEFDITQATVRFAVSGAGGKNSIYIDNVSVFKPQSGEFLVQNSEFVRYNCEIEEILPGEVTAGVSVYNYDKEGSAKTIRLLTGLFKDGKFHSPAVSDTITVNGGESATLTKTIVVPNDGGIYEIRSFAWNADLIPYGNADILK